jgi:hypothetical protein
MTVSVMPQNAPIFILSQPSSSGITSPNAPTRTV